MVTKRAKHVKVTHKNKEYGKIKKKELELE